MRWKQFGWRSTAEDVVSRAGWLTQTMVPRRPNGCWGKWVAAATHDDTAERETWQQT